MINVRKMANVAGINPVVVYYSRRAMRGCFTVAVILLLTAVAQAQQGEAGADVFTCGLHGFSMKRPDGNWAFEESQGSSDEAYSLALYPKDRKGLAQVTIRVRTPSVPGASMEYMRDAALKWTEGKPEYSERLKISVELAGRNAPGLQVDMKSAGRTFRVRQYYLIEEGLEFTVGFHAESILFAGLEPAFLAIVGTFRFIPRSGDAGGTAALNALAARCGSEIHWAPTWQEASERARREGKLVLVMVRAAGGFRTTDSFMSWGFMDQDVIDLARSGFVAWRFEKGRGAPFEAERAYGLGPSTFGTSLLAATPEGEVIGDTFSMEPSSLCRFLIRVLESRPGAPSAPPEGLKGAALAEWHIRRGEYSKAAALLESPSAPGERRVKASLHRRLREGAAAIAEIDAAIAAGDRRMAGDLDLDRAVVLMRMGRFNEAYPAISSFLDAYPESDRVPEALYLHGACSFMVASAKSAGEIWMDLTTRHPGSRWAWKAAAGLLGTGFSMGVAERVSWPSDEVLETLDPPEPPGQAPADAARDEEQAVRYLLDRQRSDGAWICPTEVAQSSDRIPGDFTIAISAICALSLMPSSDSPPVLSAIRRAIGFIRKAWAIRSVSDEGKYFMDYGVWSRSYMLLCMAEASLRRIVPAAGARKVMSELVRDLKDRQKPGGGFSYYVTRDLRTAASPANQSISFVTAGALIALARARDAGVEIPEDMSEAAVRCLESMANPDGTFEYMIFHDSPDALRKPNPAGSAGRGPVCALALLRWGKAGPDRIRKTIDAFLEHRASYAREKWKTLMHTAPDGQGSHYLLFDYACAASALAELPPGDRALRRKPILDLVMDLRGKNGCWIDNPMMGPHFGAAMALIAMQALKG